MPYKYIEIEIERKIKKLWFIESRQKWSHVIFTKENKIIVVPKHWNKDISPWVEKSIIKLLWIDNLSFSKL
jgi:predicted RNA binding protein YcfA (HicA-like mRNA interferase family)